MLGKLYSVKNLIVAAAVPITLSMAVFSAPADAARRPVIFVPGTMATAFNAPNAGGPWSQNPDTSRVWIDLDFARPWDMLRDYEVESHFRMKHLPGSNVSTPLLGRHYGTSVSYIGSASQGYFNGLIDDDIKVVADTKHVDLKNAFISQGYVLNQSLFALRYDWIQNWEGPGNACARLNGLVTEALGKSGGADKVFLVGHSQGTQVIDYCLTRGTNASLLRGKTAGVVHFAPPNHGGEAHNMYANMALHGMGKQQSMHFLANISSETSKKIMRNSPAMYMIRPDRIFEREIETTYPWIIGSFAEFQDHYICTSNCNYFGGATPPPVYQLNSRTQSVPSGSNLPWATREQQITARMHDGILAQWSEDVKGDMNLTQFRYNIPQLAFRGTGISTAVNYSVHHHTYNTVRPDFPMPVKSSSVVYSTGDGSVPWESTRSPRTSGAYSIYTYQSNLSSTPGCDDRDHLTMFFGSCAAEKVGRFITWANGVGRFSGSSASLAHDDLLNAEIEVGMAPAATKQTEWRNLSFFIPITEADVRTKLPESTIATLSIPSEHDAVTFGVGPQGDIAYVTNSEGRHMATTTAASHRVFAERVPSTSRGVDLIHVSLQVPMSGSQAIANVGTSITVSDVAGKVMVWTEDVDATNGESKRQAPNVHINNMESMNGGGAMRFRVDQEGTVFRH